ncbi:unnamed protein product [Amoebophrya sp. A25]|nr:unnamed protein product [Amoebophrya sp. A25]|eukprot:GSA25T00000578001.1
MSGSAPQMNIFGFQDTDIPLAPPFAVILCNIFTVFLAKGPLKWKMPLFPPETTTLKKRLVVASVFAAAIAYQFYLCKVSLHSTGSGIAFTPVEGITRSGPYAYSRNPLYLQFFVEIIPLMAYISNSRWVFFWHFPVMLLYLTMVVVPAEEAFLLKHHASTYTDYYNTVPRWF